MSTHSSRNIAASVRDSAPRFREADVVTLFFPVHLFDAVVIIGANISTRGLHTCGSTLTSVLVALPLFAVTFCLEVFLRVRYPLPASFLLILQLTPTLSPTPRAAKPKSPVSCPSPLLLPPFPSPTSSLTPLPSHPSVILRLWRLIKLVSTVSVDVTEYNDVEAPKPRSRSPTFAEDTEAWWAREKQALIAELEEVKEQLEKANGALTRAVENGFA